MGTRILRRRWKPLVGAAVVFGAIALVISDTASAHFSDVLSPMLTTDPVSGAPVFSATDADIQRLTWAALASICGSLIAAACLTVFALVASIYVEREFHGGSTTLGAAVAHALRRAPVALVTWLVTMLTIIGLIVAIGVVAILSTSLFPGDAATGGGFGVLLALIAGVAGVVALVAIGARWSVATAVVALEAVGPIQALRRAWHLTGNNTWHAFWLQFVVMLVVSIVAALVSTMLSVVVLSFVSDGSALQFGLQVALSVVVALFTAPILPVMLTVLYFDLRVRRDRPEPVPVPAPQP